MLPAPLTLLDEASDGHELATLQLLLRVGLRQRPLNAVIVGFCDLDSEADRQRSGLDGRKEPCLTLLNQAGDHADPSRRHADLHSDLGVVIAAFPKCPHLLQEIDGPMLSPSAVLDQAHHQAVRLVGVDDVGGYLGLTQLDERFQPALAANQIKLFIPPICRLTATHRDRSLQADLGDVVDDLLEVPPVTHARVQDADPVDPNHLDVLPGARVVVGSGVGRQGHAASAKGERAASP